MTVLAGTSASDWWSSLTYGREAGSWTSPPAMASRRSPQRVTLARRAVLWPRTFPPVCSRSGVNARRRPAWATSSSWSQTRPASNFPPASFDAAVSRWGIIFEPDAEAAAGRIRGFLKRGARMAISSWGEPDQVPFLSIPMRTAMERLDVPQPAPGTPGPLSRPTPAAIAGLLKGGGFSKVAVEQDEVTYCFESPEQFTAYIRAIAAPIRAMIEQHAGEAQEEVWDAITQAAADAAGGAKPLRFSNMVLLASGSA